MPIQDKVIITNPEIFMEDKVLINSTPVLEALEKYRDTNPLVADASIKLINNGIMDYAIIKNEHILFLAKNYNIGYKKAPSIIDRDTFEDLLKLSIIDKRVEIKNINKSVSKGPEIDKQLDYIEKKIDILDAKMTNIVSVLSDIKKILQQNT